MLSLLIFPCPERNPLDRKRGPRTSFERSTDGCSGRAAEGSVGSVAAPKLLSRGLNCLRMLWAAIRVSHAEAYSRILILRRPPDPAARSPSSPPTFEPSEVLLVRVGILQRRVEDARRAECGGEAGRIHVSGFSRDERGRRRPRTPHGTPSTPAPRRDHLDPQ